MGIPATQVECPTGLVLVFKAENLSPACVKRSTASFLMTRGWALDPNGKNPNPENGNTARAVGLVFLVNCESSNYSMALSSILKHLQPGDYLLVDGAKNGVQATKEVNKIKSHIGQGINVGAIKIYNRIDALAGQVPNLSRGFDYVGYDYEAGRGFSPEFTLNENASVSFFDEGRSAVKEYGARTGEDAKFLLFLPYGELGKTSWNWGLAAQHADIVDVQLQAFVKDAKFFNYTLDTLSEMKQMAPSTKAFVQISLIEKRGTAGENLSAINKIRGLPLDGFMIYYHPSQIAELDQFLQMLP